MNHGCFFDVSLAMGSVHSIVPTQFRGKHTLHSPLAAHHSTRHSILPLLGLETLHMQVRYVLCSVTQHNATVAETHNYTWDLDLHPKSRGRSHRTMYMHTGSPPPPRTVTGDNIPATLRTHLASRHLGMPKLSGWNKKGCSPSVRMGSETALRQQQ